MITAKEHGWPFLKRHVIKRDGMCLARRSDVFGADVAGDCKDEWGNIILPDDLQYLEFDHVKESVGASLRAEDDEAHGVAVCPNHHRLGYWRIDSKLHRAVVRDYLTRLYPDSWL